MQRQVCAVKTKLEFGEADRIAKKFRFRGCKGLIQVYRCPECHQFHLGGIKKCFKAEQLKRAQTVREQRRSRRTRLGRD